MSMHPLDTSSQPLTLVDVLRHRAAERPQAVAYTFLADGDADETSLTCAALEEKVRAIAARLQALGCSGQRALLVYQPGLEYVAGFLGCLFAGVTAVPAYPPDPFRMERTFPRFQSIVRDSQPKAILTTEAILELAGDLFDEYPEFAGIERVASDTMPLDLATGWTDPAVGSGTLAFLQYTSGSTAEPKGVMLTHGNLMHNLALIHEAFAMSPESLGMIWLPPYHDMGLIGGILEPLYAGVPVVLMSPLDFLQRPLRWLTAITRYRATVSGGPNFAYDLCARKVTAQQKATLDLSSWRVAFNGAEPIRKETLERFCEAFAPCGFRREAFYPCYGLAEATLIASGGRASDPPVYCAVGTAALGRGQVAAGVEGAADTTTLVGCGRTLEGQEIAIVDPDTELRCGADRVGEVWIAGDSVAQGYWSRPDDSAATFRARLADSDRSYLRTGDLGFLRDGELFIAGRIKDLIIIDGRNHYPQDIELTVERSHPAVRPGCVAAFPLTIDGQERLALVAEIGREYKPAAPGTPAAGGQPQLLDPVALLTAIRRAVAENHDLRVHAVALLKAGGVPKTSSGKIQRRASKAAYLAGVLEPWAPPAPVNE